MAVRSIIDIEVNSAEFQKFMELFGEYKKMLGEMPGEWAVAGTSVSATRSQFEDMAALMLVQSEVLRHNTTEQHTQTRAVERTGRAVERTDRAWVNVAKSTKSVATNILSATTSLLKWSAITGVLTGVVGGGGLFGLDRLANDVGGRRRLAQGLNVTYGEETAFSNNFRRLVEPHAFLSGVNESLTDPSKRGTLYGAGLTENDLQGRDTTQVGVEALKSLKRLADATPREQLGSLIDSRQLGGLTNVEQLQRLKATSAEEFQSILKRYAESAKENDLPDDTQRRWQDLGVQFTNSWTKIENTFVKGLTGLATPLENLGNSFSTAAAAFLANPHLKDWIDDFGKGVQWLATKLGSEDFQADVMRIVNGVKAVASAADQYLPSATPTSTPEDTGAPQHPPQPGDTRILWYRTVVPGGTAIDKLNFLTKKEKEFGLPNGILSNLWEAESSGGKNAGMSPKGALGDFQFLPETAKQYGVTDRRDFFQSAGGAAEYLSDLRRKYNGDIAKAVAAYNRGPGNLDNDIQGSGQSWRDRLPTETKNFVNRVVVEVNNNTGGNAAVSTSQLPQ